MGWLHKHLTNTHGISEDSRLLLHTAQLSLCSARFCIPFLNVFRLQLLLLLWFQLCNSKYAGIISATLGPSHPNISVKHDSLQTKLSQKVRFLTNEGRYWQLCYFHLLRNYGRLQYLVMDMGVPQGVLAWSTPVPAEFPSHNNRGGIPTKFLWAGLIFKYIDLIYITSI